MFEEFYSVMIVIMDLMNMNLDLYGYQISFWNITSFAIVSGAIGWAIWEVLLGDR